MRSGSRSSSMTEDWDAAAYHRVSDPQFAWGLRVLERAAFRGGELILDAGSGTGRITAELIRRLTTGHVVAVDGSESMSREAVRTLSSAAGARRDHWDVLCADLLDLPFRESFDAVFSTATFHWILDHPRLFSGIHSVLRAGGRLEAQCGGGPNLERLHTRALALMATAPFERFASGWTEPWEFADAFVTERRLRVAGFAQVTCWIEAMPTSFDSETAFRQFIEKVVMRPFLERLPSAELRDDMLDQITAAAVQDNPPLTLDYWRLNISAVRD